MTLLTVYLLRQGAARAQGRANRIAREVSIKSLTRTTIIDSASRLLCGQEIFKILP